ncbi:unnamed protein product [Amoebophrya sp. A120]|nr:unnamed protein product [Amoebophrya sp. A120]|eukprot:GSA120T00013882001.1
MQRRSRLRRILAPRCIGVSKEEILKLEVSKLYNFKHDLFIIPATWDDEEEDLHGERKMMNLLHRQLELLYYWRGAAKLRCGLQLLSNINNCSCSCWGEVSKYLSRAALVSTTATTRHADDHDHADL